MIMTYAAWCVAWWDRDNHLDIVNNHGWLFYARLTDCVWFVPGTLEDMWP
jgi:hypothetical protein